MLTEISQDGSTSILDKILAVLQQQIEPRSRRNGSQASRTAIPETVSSVIHGSSRNLCHLNLQLSILAMKILNPRHGQHLQLCLLMSTDTANAFPALPPYVNQSKLIYNAASLTT
ncbi:hypothetical protein V6N12_047697 [Hibiscus sabdariffa]|uniref:Uncharacterized protein n=1 Tax=Hibiscus sabdariffa TaxID=183260 RepID=A0ABR2CW85_9ROSI